jgi:hypothetical protein
MGMSARYLREEVSGLGVRGNEGPYEKAASSAPTSLDHVRRAVASATRENNAPLVRELNALLDRHAGSTNQDTVAEVDESEGDNDRDFMASALQGILDDYDLEIGEAQAIRDAIKCLTGGRQTSESLRTKNYADSLLEGRSPAQAYRRHKLVKQTAKKLKR